MKTEPAAMAICRTRSLELDRSTLFMKRRRRARISRLVAGLDMMVDEEYGFVNFARKQEESRDDGIRRDMYCSLTNPCRRPMGEAGQRR